MSSPLIAGRKTRLSGKRFARALLGFRARRADAINLCITGKLKGKKHPSAPVGVGGMRNVGWQGLFISAKHECDTALARKRR
ncbi:MAG: hypothetical protein KJ587_19820 [Alphaproteobacteria bacterium]|nr:hypothetical protein [Alphaproteobacteria bacterium]